MPLLDLAKEQEAEEAAREPTQEEIDEQLFRSIRGLQADKVI